MTRCPDGAMRYQAGIAEYLGISNPTWTKYLNKLGMKKAWGKFIKTDKAIKAKRKIAVCRSINHGDTTSVFGGVDRSKKCLEGEATTPCNCTGYAV